MCTTMQACKWVQTRINVCNRSALNQVMPVNVRSELGDSGAGEAMPREDLAKLATSTEAASRSRIHATSTQLPRRYASHTSATTATQHAANACCLPLQLARPHLFFSPASLLGCTRRLARDSKPEKRVYINAAGDSLLLTTADTVVVIAASERTDTI